jgi:hypothetical protein
MDFPPYLKRFQRGNIMNRGWSSGGVLWTSKAGILYPSGNPAAVSSEF